MSSLLWPLTPWHWLTFGLLLIVGEALLPGFVLLWFGIGALVTGVALLFDPSLTWQLQAVLFAAVSVMSLVMWRARLRKYPPQSEKPNLNERGQQFIGRVVVTSTAIENGNGRVSVGDSSWRATGPNCAAGTAVRVTDVQGGTLHVELTAKP